MKDGRVGGDLELASVSDALLFRVGVEYANAAPKREGKEGLSRSRGKRGTHFETL